MTSVVNQVTLIGNVGKDPEVGSTQKGTATLKFSIAVRRPFSKDATDWFDCVVFGKLAELMASMLHSGSKIAVGGRIETYEYESKKNPGTKVRGVSIVVEDIQLLTPKQKGAGKPAAEEEAVEETGQSEWPF